MKKGACPSRFEAWIFSGSAFFLIVVLTGYSFPTANHGQEIPPILAQINPALFQNDIAVQSYLRPGVRTYYQNLIVFISSTANLSLATTYAFLYVIALISFLTALLAIVRSLEYARDNASTRFILILSGVFIWWCFSPLQSWGSTIFMPRAIPSTFAMAISIWGVYSAIKDHWVVAYSAFGLAAIFQFLVGFLPGIVLFLAFSRHMLDTKAWRTGSAALGFWGIGLALVYIPMILESGPNPPDTFNFFSVFGLYRVPHHWVPSTGSAILWSNDALAFLAALMLVRYHRSVGGEPRTKLARISGSGIAVVVTAVALNYVFVEIFPNELIGKLQFQRIMPFGHLLLFMLLLPFFGDLLARRQYGSALALSLAPAFLVWGAIVFLVTAVNLKAEWRGRGLEFAMAALGVFLIPLVIPGAYLLSQGHSLSEAISIPLGGVVTFVFSLLLITSLIASAIGMTAQKEALKRVWFVIALVGSAVVAALLYNPSFQQVLEARINHLALNNEWLAKIEARWSLDRTVLPGHYLAEKLKEESAVDDVVLLPPFWDPMFDLFQINSERSAYFVHKNVPYSNFDVYLWSERGKELLGEELSPFMSEADRRENFSRRSVEDLEHLSKREGICFVVSNPLWHGAIAGEEIATESDGDNTWTLWHLDWCSERTP